MKESYLDLKNIFEKENIYISYIISKPYKDEMKFFNDIDNVIADFNYNGDGFFTKIELFAQEQNALASKLKDILENL